MPCPCVRALPHVSPVRAPENRMMNRSKQKQNSTTEKGHRAGGVDQESRRATTTTENEQSKSSVTTVKNSHLACKAALQPTEEQRNSGKAMYSEVPASSVRDRSAANVDPLTVAGMLKNAVLSILSPEAAVFCTVPFTSYNRPVR